MSMTPEDRDLLLSLRREHANLQQSLEAIHAQLGALEARSQGAASEPVLPPLPAPAHPELPAIPIWDVAGRGLPPIPDGTQAAMLPPLPSGVAPVTRPSLEFRFGRWLTWIGAFFGVIALGLILALPQVQALLGHAGLLALSAAAGIIVVALAGRFERKGTVFFGRSLTAMGLAWVYLTGYAACYDPYLRVITNPIVAGFVLLLWSIYVLLLAERKKSQILGSFAIILAYVSTAINPVDRFTLAADLILAATAALFLLRDGWAVVSLFSIAGTYLALLRRLLIDQNGEVVLDTSRTLHFLPHAVYLVTAWFLFTCAVILTRSRTFRGGLRLALVSLNNAGVAGLLTLTAYIAGYGASDMGWALLGTGVVFLVTSRFAGFAENDPADLMAAYAAQGLAAFTAGIIVVFTGVTRAVLLLAETFLLGIGAAFSGDRILTVSTYVAGAFAALFSIWEIAVYAHHPWLLGFGGGAIMLINAWSSRGEVRHSPKARSTVVLSSSCYCMLGLGLIFTALATELGQNTLPPALALAALVLTFSIYYFSLFELPPLAQILLLVAQLLVIFPTQTGEELPWWSTACVAAVTLVLVAWWSRQRITRSGSWTVLLTLLYALALVGMAIQAVRPYLDLQGWMIGASLLSVAFLIFGAFTRVWSIAAMGQFFLLLAVYHFFFPPVSGPLFPWTGLAAAVPIVVVFATARAAQEWLRLFPEIAESWRRPFGLLAGGYHLLALAMLVRWVVVIVPPLEQVASFLFLGTLVLSWNVRRGNAFGVRCSFVLSALGLCLYLADLDDHGAALATFLNALAMLLFLSQSALLRPEGKLAVTRLESWTVMVLAVSLAWVFVSTWVLTRLSPGYLTMGWALYALFLFLFGLLVWDRRLRWCGLAVLIAAIVRVFLYDLWGLPNGYRVLTVVVLTLITLTLGYVILRLADRRRSWL